jgi:hypothetical protein
MKRPRGGLRLRFDSVETDLRKIWYEYMDRIWLAQRMVQWSNFVKTGLNK